ncbi:MAG: SDR family NAD(P)-dependent oxidoreductase [Rhizobiales bacterium]|nr:SDR family NAD(P)-dependent oxidoreductase [Hyphomicrobiales bacterium]
MRLDGKTILITGSTDGVGQRVAERLGAMGARALVHGRDHGRGARVVDDLHAAGAEAIFYPADLASLAEVRRLADTIRNDHDRLDVLVNNAGIGSGGRWAMRQVSADGHELRFAVNYLAGFLLTALLLPMLRTSTPARIVNVASAGQYPIDFDDVMITRGYSGGRAYTQSKLAQIMFSFDLAQRLNNTGVTVTCLHPATYMDTTMVRQAGTTPLSSVDDGADAIINLAVAPELEGCTGLYFNRLQEAQANPQAYDQTARATLRDLSLRLTGLAPA